MAGLSSPAVSGINTASAADYEHTTEMDEYLDPWKEDLGLASQASQMATSTTVISGEQSSHNATPDSTSTDQTKTPAPRIPPKLRSLPAEILAQIVEGLTSVDRLSMSTVLQQDNYPLKV